MTAEASNGNWLQEYLAEAVAKNLCTRISCTTCGALEFRRGLLKAAARAIHGNSSERLDPGTASTILHALAHLQTPRQSQREMEEAVRMVLFDLWTSLMLHNNEHLLGESWAGDVLQRMKAHYEAVLARSKAIAESQDPVLVQQRRLEKRNVKQQKHEERLAQKKERDRIWREEEQRMKSDPNNGNAKLS
jgi:hypothetical protein